jgi:hypothetical protein
MILIRTILFSVLIFATSFNTSTLHPGAESKSNLSGIHLSKAIRLKKVSFQSYGKYETGNYIIYVDKTEVLADLKKAVADSAYFDTLNVSSDTLDLNQIGLSYQRQLTEAIISKIEKKEAIIIDAASGKKIYKIKRRKYNRGNAPARRGGIEYIDAKNGGLILDIGLWIS